MLIRPPFILPILGAFENKSIALQVRRGGASRYSAMLFDAARVELHQRRSMWCFTRRILLMKMPAPRAAADAFRHVVTPCPDFRITLL